MRQERQADRDAKNTLVVCFDLQNVINCPRAEISYFFYKRKLTILQLIALYQRKTIMRYGQRGCEAGGLTKLQVPLLKF